MANRFSKNFILCGEIDYHCLLCMESFQTLAEVEKHLRWETHRKSVKSQTRSPKFKKDVVFKVGDIFYCEICNRTERNMDAITAHVTTDIHKANKEKPKTETEAMTSRCKRDSGYVIVADIIVEAKDWHGIIDKQCLVCATSVYGAVKHITTAEHVMNLISSEVVIEGKDRRYRKIGKNFFYCFTCKNAIPATLVDSHWTDKDHIDKKDNIYRATSMDNEDKKAELTKRLINAQSDNYNVNLDRGVAVCKKCKISLLLDFKAMLNHQKGHKDNVVDNAVPAAPVIVVECPSSSEEESEEVVYQEVQDHGKRRLELAKYGGDNFIKLNPGGSRGYCKLCHSGLSGHIKLFKEHVRGSRHRGFLELKGIKRAKEHTLPDVSYKPLTDYLTTVFYSRPVHVLWLNKQFCVDIHSFILVSDIEKNPHDKKTKCFACDDYYPQGEDLKHYKTEQHKRKFLAAKVLYLKGEFVREIRPDVYHCGFCNKVFPFWELMEKHLQSLKHKQKKNDKDLVLRIAQEWFDEKILTKTSKHPDIFYIQFICIGILSVS